jgi:hypothetical protein
MEPVKMKAPMPQLDTPSSKHEDAEANYSSNGDATSDELHESLNQDTETPAVEAPQAEVKSGGRKRRRAASSGIITA